MTAAADQTLSHLKVLIIDDDSFVRSVAASVFKSIGVGKIEAASDGAEALNILETRGYQFNVIVCDLDMPGMDGIETLRHLSEQAPGSTVIISSGAENAIISSVEELAKARGLVLLGTLPKPLTVAAARTLLERVQPPSRPVPRQEFNVEITPQSLAEALVMGHIEAWYQPKVNMADGSLKGVEALVRWRHPEQGILPPWLFVDKVDEFGLADAFTDHMLCQAVADCAEWRDGGLEVGIAVNVSVRALYRLDLPEAVMGLLRDYELAPAQLTLEVTESGLMHDITTPFDVITRLAMKGVRLSIDDFGTGYSSLRQLVRLPFKEFKLDMSFVRGAQENERVRIVLESNVEMARRLGMSCVAEGVETEDNWRMLASMQCDLAQGFLIARPMPAAQVAPWYGEWKQRAVVLAQGAESGRHRQKA